MARRIVAAAAWLALSVVAWVKRDDFKPASDENVAVMAALLAAIVVPIFLAIGALLGRARAAGVIGIVLVLTFMVYFLIVVEFFSPI